MFLVYCGCFVPFLLYVLGKKELKEKDENENIEGERRPGKGMK